MIASYLLEERDKGELSPWCEYISVLPKQFSAVPIFWDETEKEGLKGSLALPKIEHRLNVLLRDYANLCNVCFNFFVCFCVVSFVCFCLPFFCVSPHAYTLTYINTYNINIMCGCDYRTLLVMMNGVLMIMHGQEQRCKHVYTV